jgi:hypothetical protein
VTAAHSKHVHGSWKREWKRAKAAVIDTDTSATAAAAAAAAAAATAVAGV